MALLLLAGCSSQPSNSEDAGPVSPTSPTGHHSSSASSSMPSIAEAAQTLADTGDESAQILDALQVLDETVRSSQGDLPADLRASITGDVQSARDAASLEDWSAVREAASSIVQTLNR